MQAALKLLLLIPLYGTAYANQSGTQTKTETRTDTKTETKPSPVIHRTEKKETININNNTNIPSREKEDRKNFCGDTKEASEKKCKSWLKEQKASLKGKMTTSYCSDARFLYGKEEGGCSKYISNGEIKYLIK